MMTFDEELVRTVERLEQLRSELKDTEKHLEELQIKCKHLKKEDILYSWRIGNIQEAKMCVKCKKIFTNQNIVNANY